LVEATAFSTPALSGKTTSEIRATDEVSTFEVLAFDKNGEHLGEVKGWQSREDINELIKKHS
jgi:hypothetical protein